MCQCHSSDERKASTTMRIEIREANTSTPERPLWVWYVHWGNRSIGKGFSPSEKEANQQAKLAICRAPRSY